MDAGARLKVQGRGMCIMLGGSGTVDGSLFRKLTTVYLEASDECVFAAAEESEILFLGLPRLEHMARVARSTCTSAEMMA